VKAYLFPGQGSQSKGMGKDLFTEFKHLTETADQILGYSIKELCLEDPRKELNQTQFTQPALYVVNAFCYLNKMKTSRQKPDFVAGHSLGEFNALLAAECYAFEAGLKLVKKRGELMSQATEGAMAAILNATQKEIETILRQNNLNDIELVNFNTLSQIVVSGPKDQIKNAELFFQKGEMKYIPLNTSGAFHSKLMAQAGKKFENYLKKFKFSDPIIPVISNFTARPYKKGELVNNLSMQLISPVRWVDSIQYLIKKEDMDFEEIGNGDVLTKLLRKIKEQSSSGNPAKIKVLNQEAASETQKTGKVKKIVDDQSVSEETEDKAVVQTKDQTPEQRVQVWNKKYPVGTKVKSSIVDDNNLETRTEAIVLLGYRCAVYMKGYNGYFDLDEVSPLSFGS
jgi:malonyl CoA-acyl carrier protein transacylase